MNNKKIYLISAFCGLLSFSSCQNEEPLGAPATADALALLPAETPVGIQAQLQGGFAQGESRTETSTTATNWYASNEIHPTNQYVAFSLSIPGAADPDKNYVSKNDEGMPVPIPFGSLSTTEPFSSLKLKDFNLTEGDGRCVSRWTSLTANCIGLDYLYGFARLQADAQGNPVLDFGKMKRASTKVTLVLQDEEGNPILVNDNQVSAGLSLPVSSFYHIYTPEGETQAIGFSDYLKEIKTFQADEDIDPARFGFAVYDATGEVHSFSLSKMQNADGTAYYGEKNNMLTTLVRPTPTHNKDNNDNTFTLIENPQFTDADKLTIEVNTDPDGANGPLTTGKYTLKLKDVKVVENGEQKPLTALESGKHYTLTVTLQHNMLVQATATIGGWDEVSADVDLNQDPSKLPPYEYDATTKTYTVYEEPYVKTVWDMKAADDKVMYDGMFVVDGSASAEDLTSVINGAVVAGIKNYYVINELGMDEYEYNGVIYEYNSLGYAIYSLVGINEGGDPRYDPYNCYSTLSFVLADAETISDGAMNYCAALKCVSAPKVERVESSAFSACKGLEKVTLDAATTIGERAFFDCTNLKELTFGGVITEIGEEAFATYENSNTPWTLNCGLTLASGQTVGEPNVEAKTWANYTWKSITIK